MIWLGIWVSFSIATLVMLRQLTDETTILDVVICLFGGPLVFVDIARRFGRDLPDIWRSKRKLKIELKNVGNGAFIIPKEWEGRSIEIYGAGGGGAGSVGKSDETRS